MAETTYFYTTADFPESKVCVNNLVAEIRKSTILTALSTINTSGTSVDIVFKAALSTADKTTLDGDISGPAGGLIAAHSSIPVSRPQNVVVQEEAPENPTGGHYGAESIDFDAPGNATTTKDVTLPISVALICADLDAKKKNDGDEVGFDIAPETIVGTLDVDATASATVITMPQSVMDMFTAGTLYIGQSLTLDDGTSKDDCGLIKSIDQDNKTITVVDGTTNAFLAATPTYIKITTSMSPSVISNGWVEINTGDNKIYSFGDSKIGGSYIPSGKVIRIRYRNNTATQARVSVILEYLY